MVPVVSLSLLFVGCEANSSQPNGPYASPGPSAPQAVVQRGCANLTAPPSPDISFARDLLIRQGTLLQRVADDVSGAVPGGDLKGDAELTAASARSIADSFQSSTLCADLKAKLVTRSRALLDADTRLAQAAAPGSASPDVSAALAQGRAAYQDLTGVVGASSSPSP